MCALDLQTWARWRNCFDGEGILISKLIQCGCIIDGSSDPMLDDSVSEEDGSFEELTEGTPYLQPEVDLFTLNQVVILCVCIYSTCITHIHIQMFGVSY